MDTGRSRELFGDELVDVGVSAELPRRRKNALLTESKILDSERVEARRSSALDLRLKKPTSRHTEWPVAHNEAMLASETESIA
jgi:hypothetical protein